MKKVYALFAAVLFAGNVAQAQSLGGILGALGSATDIAETVSSVIYAYTGQTDAVLLPGTWDYTGPAITVGGDNVLTNIAGSATSTSLEKKVSTYLEKYGIKPGQFTITFNEDLTFSCTVRGVPIAGTWRTYDDSDKLKLQFGQAMKYLSLTGSLKNTGSGCEMLFNGKKFLEFVKKALTLAGKADSTIGAVAGLSGNFSSMKIGCKLTKQK